MALSHCMERDSIIALRGSTSPDINMAPGGRAGCSHQHGSRLQQGSWTSSWPFMVTCATDINTDPSSSRTRNPEMALSGKTGHRLHHGLRQQPRPRTSVWPLVVTWATGINMVPSCYRTMDTKVASRGSLDHGGLLIQKINCSSSWTSCHWPESG